MTRSANRTRRRSRVSGGAGRNLHAEAVATSLQSTYGGWVIIWSAWRQAFTAFSAISTDPVVIDEPSVSRLLQRIGEVELAARTPGHSVDGVVDDVNARRAAETMRDRIVCGDRPSGRKILSGDELAPILRVDRRAVHRALSHLERLGYLRTVPGKGTYVRPPSDWP
ncbi:GntR family transcriptional regulator [Actinoallomurus sp. NPDC050550]|uniref:GntR family transcriptional regulator n=1 Tax=Actinoallomurus sp. NPDC050550 TaxID=3154937 RepID=UPI0033E44BB6